MVGLYVDIDTELLSPEELMTLGAKEAEENPDYWEDDLFFGDPGLGSPQDDLGCGA